METKDEGELQGGTERQKEKRTGAQTLREEVQLTAKERKPHLRKKDVLVVQLCPTLCKPMDCSLL